MLLATVHVKIFIMSYCKVILYNTTEIGCKGKIKEEVFELEYEEAVEIFSCFRHLKKGNEAFESAMEKASQIFKSLPITDY
jgi:hypothetical protein